MEGPGSASECHNKIMQPVPGRKRKATFKFITGSCHYMLAILANYTGKVIFKFDVK